MTFTFNGTNEFDIIVLKSNHMKKSKKRIELIPVPGRMGDLIIDEKSRENINLKLQCMIDIKTDKKLLLNELDTWLNGHEGYKDLVFSDGMRFKAVFIGELELPNTYNNFSEFELNFSAYEVI